MRDQETMDACAQIDHELRTIRMRAQGAGGATIELPECVYSASKGHDLHVTKMHFAHLINAVRRNVRSYTNGGERPDTIAMLAELGRRIVDGEDA